MPSNFDFNEMKILYLFIPVCFIVSCLDSSSFSSGQKNTALTKNQKQQIIYDLGCLRDSSLTDGLIGIGSQLEDNIISGSQLVVKITDEIAVGDSVLNQVKNKHKIIEDGDKYLRVEKIMKKLLLLIDSQYGFKYKYYVVESEEVNAFTAGGKIFVYTGIMKHLQSDDELACVLGHEIYHNELGHIRKKIKKQMVVDRLLKSKKGKFAGYAMLILGASFNQDEETLCDLHGVDLVKKAGYKPCSAIDFWKRISQNEKTTSLSKLLKSHPCGKQRIHCIHHHLEQNYQLQCDN